MVFKSSKKEEVVQETEVAVEEVKPQLNLTHLALSMYKNVNDGLWYVVRVQYNPVTGDVGNYSAEPTNSNYRDVAEEQFKKAVVEQLFDV